jgi:hypothetical protein
MLKAINLSPGSFSSAFPGTSGVAAQEFLKQPGSCDAVMTWAPTQSNMGPNWWQSSWAQSDTAVEWILGAGKRCFVCVPSSDFTDDAYSNRLQWTCDTIERYPQCSVVVSNEPAFAGINSSDSAQLIRDAAEHAASVKSGSKHLLGPAEATFWGTPNVLKHLLAWTPPKGIRVDVAMHHYYDIVNGGARQTRTALAALTLLVRWHPNLFLTEGGFKYTTHTLPDFDPKNPANPATWAYTDSVSEEALQLRRVPLHFKWCGKQQRIALWANYEYIDSLWGGWASGLIAHDGTPHPLRAVWPKL